MPEETKYRTWIQEDFMIREGYSMEDIENMDPERYDFILMKIIKRKTSGKGNPFTEGI